MDLKLWAVLLLTACSTVPGVTETPGTVMTVEPELESAADAALDLWERASDGTAMFGEVSITLGAIPECAAAGKGGCLRIATRQIDVSPSVLPESRASTIAHEFGHLLGLPDMPGSGTLMDPNRTDRAAQCIDVSIIRAAGLDGPGACL